MDNSEQFQNEPEPLRGILPPSFRAWHQLYDRIKRIKIKDSDKNPKIQWTEYHPAGLRQAYEYTLDEIKARVLEELLQQVEKLLTVAGEATDLGSRHASLEELYRFMSYRYFKKP